MSLDALVAELILRKLHVEPSRFVSRFDNCRNFQVLVAMLEHCPEFEVLQRLPRVITTRADGNHHGNWESNAGKADDFRLCGSSKIAFNPFDVAFERISFVRHSSDEFFLRLGQ